MKTPGKNNTYIIILSVIISILAFGWFINNNFIKSSYDIHDKTQIDELSPDHLSSKSDKQLKHAFETAINYMQIKNHQKAIKAWHDVLNLNPELPEAHVNMGFSLYELEEYDAAMNFFISAMEINPYQANAYYGLAIAYEKQGDLEAATGAMRSYIHLASAGNFIRKARSALWEWEASLKNRDDLPDNVLPAQ